MSVIHTVWHFRLSDWLTCSFLFFLRPQQSFLFLQHVRRPLKLSMSTYFPSNSRTWMTKCSQDMLKEANQKFIVHLSRSNPEPFAKKIADMTFTFWYAILEGFAFSMLSNCPGVIMRPNQWDTDRKSLFMCNCASIWTNESSQNLVMNQHLLVIFVYVHQRYNTWYVETVFFVYTIDRGKNSCFFFCLFFCLFSLSIVYLPHAHALPLHQSYNNFTKKEGLEK